VATAPTIIIATFAPSTPTAPADLSNSPRPAATPMYETAGIVVTEMATPTPDAARVSSASIPAMPATRATAIVSLLTVVSPPNTPVS